MPKELSDDQVRITVRLPAALYEDLVGPGRRYYHTGKGALSCMVRRAIQHFLDCPDLQRAEADARAAFEERAAAIEQEVAAWAHAQAVKEAARMARPQAAGRPTS
jgi:hypothetical protein